jgi:transposase-like protein
MKKGHTYGTIICDHQTHLPIDLLPSRESDVVADWLTEHQEVVLVSRDRYAPYREAVATTAPSIIEVLDRFHLIKNLWDLHEHVLTPSLPISILISPLTETMPSTDREIQSYNPKREKILAIQQARANGEAIASIARRFNVSRPTVYHYLRLREPITPPRRRRPRAIDEWKSRLEVFEGQHRTVRQIQRLMREEGYCDC